MLINCHKVMCKDLIITVYLYYIFTHHYAPLVRVLQQLGNIKAYNYYDM